MSDRRWHLPVIYDANTPVLRPLFARSLRAGIVFGIEWSTLSLIEDAPRYVKISTLVISILVLAVLESRYFLMLKGRWYFPSFLAGLIFVYIGVLAYAVEFSPHQSSNETAVSKSAQAQATTTAVPAPAPPLSDDEKLFRDNLRRFIRSDVSQQGQAFSAMALSLAPLDATSNSYALNRMFNTLFRAKFNTAFSALQDDSDKLVNEMDVTKIMSDLRAYYGAYGEAQGFFFDFLKLSGQDPNKNDLLANWLAADRNATRAYFDLQSSPIAKQYNPANIHGEADPEFKTLWPPK
jgi:hypothetical protein